MVRSLRLKRTRHKLGAASPAISSLHSLKARILAVGFFNECEEDTKGFLRTKCLGLGYGTSSRMCS
jgi:hypothetical protein